MISHGAAETRRCIRDNTLATFHTLKALNNKAQGQPSDAVAKAPPWVCEERNGGRELDCLLTAVPPRPQRGEASFGLGMAAFRWWPMFSAEETHGWSPRAT